jgi:hypothetical protein
MYLNASFILIECREIYAYYIKKDGMQQEYN